MVASARRLCTAARRAASCASSSAADGNTPGAAGVPGRAAVQPPATLRAAMSAAHQRCRISRVFSACRPCSLEHFDLLLEAVDLRLLLRALQRVLVQTQGLLRLADLAI